MRKLGIIAAMEEELEIIKNALEDQTQVDAAHMSFYTGTVHEQDLVIVQSGIGKVNAAMAAVILVEKFGVDAIINTGSAGALAAELEQGDLVVSQQLAYHDVDATAFGYAVGQVPQMPLYYKSDAGLNEKIEEAAHQADWKVIFGDILTSDSFIADSQALEKIKNDFPEALVTEMEGAAIAQVASQYGLPFTVVRAVSDSADGQAAQSFDEFITEAGKKSADMVLKYIAQAK